MTTLEDKFESLFGMPAVATVNPVSIQSVDAKNPEGSNFGKILLVVVAITVGVIVTVNIVNYLEEQEDLKKKGSVA